MTIDMLSHFTLLANESAVSSTMQNVIEPIMLTVSAIAGLTCTLFLVIGGVNYMSSSGQPERLTQAKKIIRNAIIGLVLVLAAASLTAILTNAYSSTGSASYQTVPALNAIKPASTSFSLAGVIIKAITDVLQNIVQSIAAPFINALQVFTTATPLMATNATVFNLWLAVLAIGDSMFVLVIAALGFHLMSSASLGLEEVEFKHLLPQLGAVFLLMNSSIFILDTIIGISNGMIDAIRAGFGSISVWQTLISITQKSTSLGLAALLIMIVFTIMAVILLIYYVGRLVTLYLGAALSPLICLLWLLPSFKDFASNAFRIALSVRNCEVPEINPLAMVVNLCFPCKSLGLPCPSQPSPESSCPQPSVRQSLLNLECEQIGHFHSDMLRRGQKG